ncbi:16S rRNA (cytosine(967)-C(5))-methyltransferase RsmB [Paenibacillus zanthoxyli]|uniref:16S rRNA (cytosine(967)-C(5))-methyltransferase RsmB n=1 Tax=Paenibacillus zanthoxyli TaxID=369399 RepID=UPI000470F009|nr:16S rRNA (cytosine(967)-C(5))-methyltransferase RsmB [Paenibacillus zanthoxyli]
MSGPNGRGTPTGGNKLNGRAGAERSGNAGSKGGRPGRGRGSAGETRTGAKGVTARETALDVLVRVQQEGAYSNLLLNTSLQKAGLSREDAGLATELVYGTISRLNTLEYVLKSFVSKGLDKLQPWVRSLLCLSLYQIMYLDRIPPHAAVNEAVNLAKRRGHQGISGMVNGVLRNVLRAGPLPVIPQEMSWEERTALIHSHPLWMVEQWRDEFGADTAEAICKANNEPPAVSVRVNTTMTSRDRLLDEMLGQGVNARPSELSPYGIVVRGAGNLALSSWYRDGLLSIQDESSMLVAEAVNPLPGMKVLDCCAAPGGKTTHMGELMKDQGSIYANDLHPHKAALISDQARRLGLECIGTGSGDALELGKKFAAASFDRILLDAPCSGLGVIRRKPDLKWAKQPEDAAAIARLQSELLDSAAALLKPGGVLVYSTCTLDRLENGNIVHSFLERNEEFRSVTFSSPLWNRLGSSVLASDQGMQILPQHYGSDGFYIAILERLRQ